MASPIGAVRVFLGLDSAEYEKKVKKAQKSITVFGRRIGSASKVVAGLGAAFGAIAVGGMLAFTRQSLRTVDAQAKLADNLNLSTKSLAGFNLQFELTGLGADKGAKALEGFQRRLGEAKQGIGTAIPGLESLGLSADKLVGIGLDEAFLQVADAVGELSTAEEQAAVVGQLFGSRNTAIVKTLKEGGDKLREAADRAETYGAALSRVDSTKIEQANDALTESKTALNGIANRFGSALSPVITAVARSFQETAIEAKGFENIAVTGAEAVTNAIGIIGDRLQDVLIGFKILQASGAGIVGIGDILKAAVDPGRTVQDGLNEADARIRSIADAIVKLANAPDFSDVFEGKLAAIRAEAAATAKALEAERKKLNSNTGSGVIAVTPEEAEAAEKRAELARDERRVFLEQQEQKIQGVRDFLKSREELELEAYQARRDIAREQAEEGLIEKAEAQQIEADLFKQYSDLGLQREKEAADKRQRIIEASENVIRAHKLKTFQLTVGLLNTFGRQSKTAAIAAIALSKGLAIAQAIQYTAVAVSKAAIIGPAAVARAKAFGAAQVAIIAATGLGEISNVSSGAGGPLGTTSDPLYTQPTDSFGSGSGRVGPREVNVFIDGSGFVSDLMAELAEQINDGAGGDFRIKVIGNG